MCVRARVVKLPVFVRLWLLVTVPVVLVLTASGGCARSGGTGDANGVSDGTDNCGTGTNASALDTDADGVGNACDNCPASANPDQQDGNADGIGDACDRFASSSLAVAAPNGAVIDMVVDADGRPTQLAGPDFQMSLAWSADAGTVDVTYDDGIDPFSISLPLDWSEEALLAGVDQLEAETGRDFSLLRGWVTDHPELTAKGRATSSARLAGPAPTAARKGRLQDFTPPYNAEVDQMLTGVEIAVIHLHAAWAQLSAMRGPDQPPEVNSHISSLLDILQNQMSTLEDFCEKQADWCTSCNVDTESLCRADCRLFGACYFNPADQTADCGNEVSFADCQAFGGTWGGPDTYCGQDNPLGACYYGQDACEFTSESLCINDIGGLFFSGSKCEDRTPGACCTTIWETDANPVRDYTCRDTYADDCVGPDDAFNPNTTCNSGNGVSCRGTIAGVYFP
jgi:hypothetical protein